MVQKSIIVTMSKCVNTGVLILTLFLVTLLGLTDMIYVNVISEDRETFF